MNWPFSPSALIKNVGNRILDWKSALRIWASPQENPFLNLGLRQESRNALLWRALFAILLLMAPVGLLMWNICHPSTNEFFPLARQLGFEPTGFFAVVWLQICLLVATITSKMCANALLRTELFKGRLEMLLGLPIESDERIWQLTALPTLLGLLILLVALPAVLLLQIRGVVTGFDWLGLPCLAVALIYSVPSWHPQKWEAQLEKRAPPKNFEWKPANLHFLGERWWLAIGLIALGTVLLRQSTLQAFIFSYMKGWPVSLQEDLFYFGFMPAVFIARWLVTAQPFFVFSLPPVALLLPLWMAKTDQRLLLRAASLADDRHFWTAQRQQRWQRDNWWSLIAGTLSAVGFFLPGLWRDGMLGNLLSASASTSLPINDEGAATAAWMILCLAVGALSATAHWRAELQKPRQKNQTLKRPIRKGFIAALRTLGGATLFFIFTCLLSGRWPISSEVLQVLVPTLSVMTAWFLAQGAFWLLFTARSNDSITFLKLPATLWFILWFYLPLVCFWGLWQFDWPMQTIEPYKYLLSPWTLWIALNDLDIIKNFSFWVAIGLHVSVSIYWLWRINSLDEVDFSLLLKLERRRKSRQSRTVKSPLEKLELMAHHKPVPDVAAPVSARVQTNLNRVHLSKPTTSQKRVLGWLNRFDNPLLHLETRRAMGHVDWIATWLTYPMVSAGIGVALLLWAIYDRWLADASLLIFIVATGIYTAASLISASKLVNCYDRDRLDRSLEMLFLTPFTERDIALSKIGPLLLYTVPMLALYWPLIFPLMLIIGYTEPNSFAYLAQIWLVIPILLMALLLRNLMLGHLFSALSKRTGEATQWLALIGTPLLVGEFGCLFWLIISATQVSLAAIVGLLWWLGQSVLCWFLGLHVLRRQRARPNR